MEENSIQKKNSLNSLHCYCINLENMTIQDLNTAKDSRSPSLEEIKNQKQKEEKLIQGNLINRKTKRGRKEKITLPKNQLKCGICLEISNFLSEELISCSICKCFFHISCYNQWEISIIKEKASYTCIRCAYALKINKNINDYHCLICGNSNGVLNKKHNSNEFFHQLCLNLLIEFKELPENDITIDKIRKWRYKNSCRYCGVKLSKSQAVIKCKNPKCKQFYHIPCAIEKGMLFDLKFMKKYYNVEKFSDIPFYCSNHNKKISFLYKNSILNGNKGGNENRQKKISNNLHNFKNKKIKRKNNGKEKINQKILFKITKNNKQKEKMEEKNLDNNINKENMTHGEIVVYEENIDNDFEENKKNNIFNMDFEIKDGNIDKKIFLEEYEANFQNIKNYNNDDSFSKGNDENSIFTIK